MKRRYTICAAALAAVMAFGCGKDDSGTGTSTAVSSTMGEEELMQQTLGAMREMTATLKTVKDEASAKAAEPKLKELKTRMEAIEKAVQAKGNMPADREKAMQDKYKVQFETTMGEFMKEGMRISMDPKLATWMDSVMPGGPAIPRQADAVAS